MQKEIGKEYRDQSQRESFLRDNCDKVEERGYMKPFTADELQENKDKLAAVSVRIDEIEEERKDAAKRFKDELKPLTVERRRVLGNIKNKAQFVRENCFKFVDHDTNEVGYYNSDGDLIESRKATADERQQSVFSVIRKNAN
jgi:hypothetical protein